MAATLDAVLGIDVQELDAEHVVASFEVRDEHRQRFGLVHGGTYAPVAEVLASEGTVRDVAGHDGRHRPARRAARPAARAGLPAVAVLAAALASLVLAAPPGWVPG